MRVNADPQDVCQVMRQYWDEIPEEWKEIIENGRLPNELVQLFTLHPQLFLAFSLFVKNVYNYGMIDSALKEKLNLKVALLNSCTFTGDSQMRFIRDLLGSNEPVVMRKLDPAHLSVREQVALEFAERLIQDSNQISDSLFSSLRDHFEPKEIAELIMLVGEFHKMSMCCNAFQLNSHPKSYWRMKWEN